MPEVSAPRSSGAPSSTDSATEFGPIYPPEMNAETSKHSFQVVQLAGSDMDNSVCATSTVSMSIVVITKLRFAEVAQWPSSFGTVRTYIPTWSGSTTYPVAVNPSPVAGVLFVSMHFNVLRRLPLCIVRSFTKVIRVVRLRPPIPIGPRNSVTR